MGKDLHGKSLGKGISQRKDGRYEARAIINGTKIHLYNMSLTQIRKDSETEKAKEISISKSMKIYYVNKVKYQVVKAPKTLTGYRIIQFLFRE